MTCASRVINHSRKLRNVSALLRQENALFVRWITNSSHTVSSKRDDALRIRHHGYVAVEKQCYSKSLNDGMMSSPAMLKSSMHWMMAKKSGNPPALSLQTNKSSLTSVHLKRGFSSDSGLPPHQEIGMPSLSPTMTEGNIARWLKKEGDKMSPGEVLCEVETDKATVEMECMEEGYLAKIVKGDGSKEIKVGEVIAITVEDEEDIQKFTDYSASAAEDKVSADKSEPSTPKKRSN